jgi:hypothetical protein
MSSQASLIAAFFGSDPYPTPLSPPRIIGEVPAPVATFDGITHTITIFRKSGAWLKRFFEDHSLSVRACPATELSSLNLSPFEREQVKVANGLIHCLQAQPRDTRRRASFIWLESEEEAIAVDKAIREPEVVPSNQV